MYQSLEGLGELCKKNGTLLIVDTVCSLGGVPFFADAWGVDCSYSGSQKCLSAPPGTLHIFIPLKGYHHPQSKASNSNHRFPPSVKVIHLVALRNHLLCAVQVG